MEILRRVILVISLSSIFCLKSADLTSMPAEIKLEIMTKAASIDDARNLIVNLDKTNKSMHAILRDERTIGQIILELSNHLAKPFPYVATMLHHNAPAWLKQLIMQWLTAYASSHKKETAQATVATINTFFDMDPTVKEPHIRKLILSCIELLLKAGISIEHTNQDDFVGRGIQLLTLLFIGNRDHIELASALISLGVIIDYSFKLEQAVTWYDKRARGAQRTRVKPFMHLLALKGGRLKSIEPITINERLNLGQPIAPE